MTQTIHRIVAAAILLFMVACSPPKKPKRMSTTAYEILLRSDYEEYLRDNNEPFEFNSQKEFTSRLDGNNRLGIRYVMLEWYPHKDGLIIDEWGTPLQISRLKNTKLEIRSAGRDGVFGNQDDIVTLHPRVEDH